MQTKQRIKKILMKIFFLPPVPTLLISIPAYGLVIYALAGKNTDPVITYVSYLLSAYALIITITGITGAVRRARQGIGEHPLVSKALEIPLVSRYVEEKVYRVQVALYQGFFINIIYAGIKMFSGIFYKSVWFVTLAVYYLLLAIMRFFLLHHMRKGEASGGDKILEWRRYRLCGIILLFMDQALAGIVILVVHQNGSFEYPGMLIYAMALYTFYATVTAVINVIKFRKYGNPVLSAAKMISLTAALVSMLSLEVSMLSQFGTADDYGFRQIMTASTGAGISMIVLGMAVFMIVRSTRELHRY